ncbi:MAG: ATP-grasp domain-containing protein, partial [Bacteroidota bacterium]
MNLHEYQAKQILSSFGVPVPRGIMAETIEQAVDAAREIQRLSGA